MAEDDSMPAIIPMITGSMWQYQDIVRAAEIAVAEKLVNTDTTDTEGFALSSDNIHFNAESQIKIGTNCALRWLAMDYTKDWWSDTIPVPVAYRPSKSGFGTASAPLDFIVYDLSGRKYSSFPVGKMTPRHAPPAVLIGTGTSGGSKRVFTIIDRK